MSLCGSNVGGFFFLIPGTKHFTKLENKTKQKKQEKKTKQQTSVFYFVIKNF